MFTSCLLRSIASYLKMQKSRPPQGTKYHNNSAQNSYGSGTSSKGIPGRTYIDLSDDEDQPMPDPIDYNERPYDSGSFVSRLPVPGYPFRRAHKIPTMEMKRLFFCFPRVLAAAEAVDIFVAEFVGREIRKGPHVNLDKTAIGIDEANVVIE